MRKHDTTGRPRREERIKVWVLALCIGVLLVYDNSFHTTNTPGMYREEWQNYPSLHQTTHMCQENVCHAACPPARAR
jgi:hypothetical protein